MHAVLPVGRIRGSGLIILTSLLIAACNDFSQRDPIAPAFAIETWSCYDPTDPHCSHTPPFGDPSPGSAGIFLGSSMSYSACTSTSINDVDNDGLDDFCEFQIALSFRPTISTNPYDEDITREPYWAAIDAGTEIRVAYLPSYHFDNGNEFSGICDFETWGFCAGHFGDSEFTIAHIGYNPSTQHWLLNRLYTSAHWGTIGNSSVWSDSTQVEYPQKTRWWPRVYVARDKHANYRSRSTCNAGGLETDSCEENIDTDRLTVLEYRNVGSGPPPAGIDSTTTQDNPILYSGFEYYWTYVSGTTTGKFCGGMVPLFP
ncbi:MAG: hypothetical protein WEE89_05605 [Gemmatimonadota bacterium]